DAWEYTLDVCLQVECMVGRARKVWSFSAAQVQPPAYDESLQSWVINDGEADHRIVCMDAVSANDDDEADLD
ncbi:DUF5629 family protein, partial [Pandoraea sputorum]|uniref:DUF5629 family protein n=1 Tax=Pandoraea sputorum TaxID=93222 RepID=UPI003556564D